ncbi:MAG: HDIG domain-containing metalloprotein [Clostridiales bacterium]
MNRDEALNELKTRLTDKNLIKHSLAVESVMKEVAVYLKEDADSWGLAGLLHNIDYEKTKNEPEKQSAVGARILEDLGLDGSIVYAVKAHNSLHGIKRKRKMDKILYAADPMSKLIIATALILPSRKLEDIDIAFLSKKFHEKEFLNEVDRRQIKECEEAGFILRQFIEISLNAIKKISKDLDM